jgi:hypothetical protein
MRWDFATRRPSFVRRPDAGDTLPVKDLARRTGEVGRLAESLPVLPRPGEALHLLMTGRYDLTAILDVILGRLGPCQRLRIATLSFNARNVAELSAWLDAGRVGSLTLLASSFFRENSRPEWLAAVNELRQARGVRLAAARNHAKVITLDWKGGACLVAEGSANLRTNSNQEQLTLINDRALCVWHGAWMDALVSRHEREDNTAGPADPAAQEDDESPGAAAG